MLFQAEKTHFALLICLSPKYVSLNGQGEQMSNILFSTGGFG